jgi:hypothetical protein
LNHLLKLKEMLTEVSRVFGTREQPVSFRTGRFMHIPIRSIVRKKPGKCLYNISGKWDVTITSPNGTPRKALAEFEQSGDKLTGSFLTPSGDYRFLEGIVTGDSLKLSTFDGSHAYTFMQDRKC